MKRIYGAFLYFMCQQFFFYVVNVRIKKNFTINFMTDDLYNKAISFYNKGEYEEALDTIRNSSMATSKDGQSLIRECEKLILEQHVYLINEYNRTARLYLTH